MIAIANNKSTKVVMVGAAAGLALGALTQMGWLPLDPVLSALSGGEIGFGFGVQPVDFASFRQAEFMQAFHDGDFEFLEANPLLALAYLDGVNEEISSNGVLMYVSDPAILDVVDPSMNTAISRKLMTSRGAQDQMMESGLNALMGIFGAMANTRRMGGSIGDEVAAINGAIVGDGSGISIVEIKQQGAMDGRRLARTFETNRPAFERIYSNMQQYVYGESGR